MTFFTWKERASDGVRVNQHFLFLLTREKRSCLFFPEC